jgi:hypothetical protein
MEFIVFMKMKNFCEDLVDGHASARRIVFTGDFTKIAYQQIRYSI